MCIKSLYYILWASVLFAACTGLDQPKSHDLKDTLLATVGSHKLYLSDIEGFATDGMEADDSLAVLNSYVEQWVRRKAVLEYAENTITPELDIPKLMEEYKASLLLHNYRQNIIRDKLDTSVTSIQLSNFYEVNKEQYKLAEPIIRGMIAVCDAKVKGLEKFDRDWKNNKFESIESYTAKNASVFFRDTLVWYDEDEFLSMLPKNKIKRSTLKDGKNYQYNDEGSEYFVKIIEYVDTKEYPPLAYVKDKLKKVVLNTRKNELLRRIETEIYDNALDANRIKVYTK